MDEDIKKFEAMNAMDLLMLQKIYAEAQIESEIVKASDIMPVSTLITYLKKDKKNRLVTLSLTFMPLPSDVFPDIKLLQFYSELPFENKKNIASFLSELNRTLPLGSFGVSDSMKIYFRYMHAIKKYDTLYDDAELYRNLLSIITFVMDIHAETIEKECQ